MIFFHSKRYSLNYDNISIKLNGQKLVPVDHVKYLGMYIDKYLSWDFHIQQLSKKLSRANGILSKLRHNAPLEACKQVYYATFYSHLTYGCNVWGLTTDENLKKIEILQKKCVRIMTFSDFNSHTNQLFIDLKILKVHDVIDLKQLELVFDFYNNSLPTDLKNLFILCSDIHTTNMELNSAHKDVIHIPSIKTVTYGNKSIKFHCAELWNEKFKKGISIDANVSHNKSIDKIYNASHFKKTLKKHFLHGYTLED